MVPRTKSMVATALGTWYIVLIMACFKYSAGIWVFALVAIMSLSRGAPEQFASQSKPSEIDADFSNQGPCSIKTIKAKFVLPPGVDGLGKSLPITATLPSCGRNLQALRPPYPVVFFYNGFQARASWYAHVAAKIARWGYVVVQYDTSFGSLPSVASEVNAFPSLLAWVQTESGPGGKLGNYSDPSAPVVAGHSRGGKIAALIFANNNSVKAAWLIDPIDASRWAPESPENPSAARALARSGKTAGIEGAGILSSCNPTEGNYQVMFDASGPGSWEVFIPGASHSSFSDAGVVLNAVQDALCSRGRISRAEVANLTATPMLAWYWKQLRKAGVHVGPRTDPMPAFYSWVGQQQRKGLMEFKEKGNGVLQEEEFELHPLRAPGVQDIVFPLMG